MYVGIEAPLLLREELLPSARSIPEVLYQVSYQVTGSFLIQDPSKDCNPSFEGPHVHSLQSNAAWGIYSSSNPNSGVEEYPYPEARSVFQKCARD